MALDRGTLSRIDRRVFAELAHTGGVQAVKVPVSVCGVVCVAEVLRGDWRFDG